MKNFEKLTEEFISDEAAYALEGVNNPTAGSDDSPMYIDIITDKFIEINANENKMIPVTNATAKERGGVFTSDGIFSPYIFGVTPDERKTKFSYIDLETRVFHPYIYQILCNVLPKNLMSKIVYGQGSWKVVKGEIQEVMEDDPNYDPDATGIDWLIDHWDDFQWKRNSSRIRDQRVKLLASYKKEDLVITKWLVIPVFYREIQSISGIEKTPDIDKWYCDLIRYAQSYKRSPIPSMAHNTKFMIQQTLVNIRKYGQSLVQLKHGFFKKSVLGKSIDYGYRSVISCVNMDMYDTPYDNPIDMYSTGFPLAQLCVMGFPFMKAEVMEFMRQLFESIGTRYPIQDKKTGKVRLVNLAEPMAMYTEEFIQKQIDLWIETPGVRFRPVMIPTEDGEFPFRFPGNTKYNPKDPNSSKEMTSRIFTWTDLLYICANNCLGDKHVYITRYPLTDYFGIFPSRVFILSTLKTTNMTVMGKEYKYYPVVDPNLPESVVSTLFVDTVTMSVPYLKGLGGDYDGDQITEKMVFTQEANEEAERLLKSPKHYITEDEELIRVVQNEAYLTFFNMTKEK